MPPPSPPPRSPHRPDAPALSPWREAAYEVIFEADTPAGKAFDVVLLFAIGGSVLAVMLETVASVRNQMGSALRIAEWVFTIAFTIEYMLRLATVRRPWRYAASFFGVVDLLAILPTFLSVLLPGLQSLLVVRALRLLRVFRILKLGRFLAELSVLGAALRGSRHKIAVFLGTIMVVVVILGSLVYLIEGEEHGFTSIPVAIYWAIVTMTTVGYGDITPQTPAGQVVASAVMIIGYSIIAVPTGIFTAEMLEAARKPTDPVSTQTCPTCLSVDHARDAKYCKDCASAL